MHSLFILAAALSAPLAAAASEEPRAGVCVRLDAAGPVEVGRVLTEALGVPVRVDGARGRTLTLQLPARPAVQAVDRAAAALGGTWRLKLRVRAGVPERPAVFEEPSQNLTLGLADLPASRAFAGVARAVNADLELQGPLEQRVSAIAVNAPAYELLDRIAQKARASWSIGYVITAPDAPPPAPAPAALPDRRNEPAPPAPAGVEPPAAASGPMLRVLLQDGTRAVLRASPDQREQAVRHFLGALPDLTRGLDRLPAADRRGRLQPLQSLLNQWQRLVRGLAPDVRRQLSPVMDALEQNFRLR